MDKNVFNKNIKEGSKVLRTPEVTKNNKHGAVSKSSGHVKQQMRTPFYEKHWSKEDVEKGLQEGALIKGELRVNPKRNLEAFISYPGYKRDIFIWRFARRNRAFNGDIVAVQILGSITDGRGDIDQKITALENSKPVESTVESTVENASSGDNSNVIPVGKVVAILEEVHSRICGGHLEKDNSKFFQLIPDDKRCYHLSLEISSLPKDVRQRLDDHKNTKFLAKVASFGENHQKPIGKILELVGEAGQIEPETRSMLVSNQIDFSDFSQKVINCLPEVSPVSPWRIPEEEITRRRDLRRECIFTIDPASARDLDDALHCTHIEDDIYEVGVHIADVSYFVKPDTALDDVALSRATSVYLVQKVVPMLPRLLCEQLCSLNPDEDRLTFSVIWRMRDSGEILDEWFGRSVIRSVTKLSYQHAQGFIEEPDREFHEDELPAIAHRTCVNDIRRGVLNLHKIALNLRQNRYDNGALALNQVKLSYLLNKATGQPIGFNMYEQKESNRLVEEFMLLANMAVAHKIYKAWPDSAVLRNHAEPKEKMMEDLEREMSELGINLDTSNSKSIQETLAEQAGESEEDKAKSKWLTLLLSKPMQLAKYFCSGEIDEELYRHYALSVPLYTHFTSPIRRYPDILVHRLLAAALGDGEPPKELGSSVQRKCNHCNNKKKAAKTVSDLSLEMFFSLFINHCGRFEERAMIVNILDRSVDVLCTNLGLVKRIYMENNEDLEKFTHNAENNEMSLTWKRSENHSEVRTQTLAPFSVVNAVLVPGDGPLKWNMILKHPDEPIQIGKTGPLEDKDSVVEQEDRDIHFLDV